MKTLSKWNNIKIAAGILLIIIAAFLYISAVNDADRLNSYGNKISCINESKSSSPTGKAAFDYQWQDEFINEGDMSFLFWGQKDVSEIKNQSLGTAVKTPIILTSGDTELIFPDSKTLDYDTTGICLIGRHTANELFGGTDVEGLNVTFKEKEYIVHGVIDNVEDAFVISTSSEEETGLNRYEVRYDSKNQRAGIINKSNSLYSPGTVIDYDFMIFILEVLLMSIPLIILISLLKGISRESLMCMKNGNRRGRIIWITFSALSGAGFLIFAMGYIDYPIDMIPAKWSDFEFWSRLWESKWDSLRLYFKQEKTSADMLFIVPYINAVFLNFLGIIGMISGSKLINSGLMQKNMRANKIEVKNV